VTEKWFFYIPKSGDTRFHIESRNELHNLHIVMKT